MICVFSRYDAKFLLMTRDNELVTRYDIVEAGEVVDAVNMEDYTDEEHVVYELSWDRDPVRLTQIVDFDDFTHIVFKTPNGETVIDGYGETH